MYEALAQAGVIESKKFSFYFQEAASESWLELGEPDLSTIKQGSTLVETKMITPDFFWSFYNTGVAIGTIDNSFAYEVVDLPGNVFEGNGFYSILDTGSTTIMISILYFESLINNLFKYAGIDDWN